MKYALITIATITLILAGYSSQQNKPIRNSPPPIKSATTTLIATGDIMLGRTVNVKGVQQGHLWAFENTGHILSSADIALANLESPLAADCPLSNSGMIFCGSSQYTTGLSYAGVDIVNLANNHGTDQGSKVVEETKAILDNATIEHIGSFDQPLIKEVNGVSFAFLGYNTIFPESRELIWGYEDTIKDNVRAVNGKVDHVIVTIHWGKEYTDTPNEQQRDLAYAAIDEGADLIIGHHPHWIQRNEIYNGKPIYYSLGNFIFDQMWSQRTREGLVIQVTFDKNSITEIKHIPVIIEDYGQPRLTTNEEASQILNKSKIKPLIL